MSRIWPALVEVTPTPFDAHLFRHGDLHRIDGAVIPVGCEQRVGETQRQQVQHRLFAEIVVDTVNTGFVEILRYLIVDHAGGRQIGAQRFFHYHARRLMVQLGFAQPFADGAEGAWRHGEVVDGGTVFLIQHFTQFGKVLAVVDVQIAEVGRALSVAQSSSSNFSFMKVPSASLTTSVYAFYPTPRGRRR